MSFLYFGTRDPFVQWARTDCDLLRIRFYADLTIYWFPVCRFRCMEFKPLVIWIWNQNIAISTIVGTSSHITNGMKKHGRWWCW